MDYSDYIKSVMAGRFNMIDGMEEASKDLAMLSKKELNQLIKEGKEFYRKRSQDTTGYSAEFYDINHNPNLSDREIRIALCDACRRHSKQKINFHNEMCRWYYEIREEEERRAKLAQIGENAHAKLLRENANTHEDPLEDSEVVLSDTQCDSDSNEDRKKKFPNLKVWKFSALVFLKSSRNSTTFASDDIFQFSGSQSSVIELNAATNVLKGAEIRVRGVFVLRNSLMTFLAERHFLIFLKFRFFFQSCEFRACFLVLKCLFNSLGLEQAVSQASQKYLFSFLTLLLNAAWYLNFGGFLGFGGPRSSAFFLSRFLAYRSLSCSWIFPRLFARYSAFFRRISSLLFA